MSAQQVLGAVILAFVAVLLLVGMAASMAQREGWKTAIVVTAGAALFSVAITSVVLLGTFLLTGGN